MKTGDFLFISLIIILIFVGGRVNGQFDKNYKIISLEGEKTEISVVDSLQEGIWIKYRGEKRYVGGNWYGITKVQLLTDNFVEVQYGAAGGSGLHNTNILLVCVKDNRLHVALDMEVESLFNDSYGLLKFECLYCDSSRLNGVGWAGLYIARIKAVGAISSNNFQLQINTRQALKSTEVPRKEWYDRHTKAVLRFDMDRCVFYTSYKFLDGTFYVYDEKTGKVSRQSFHGTFPVIDSESEYFINGKWYFKNTLFGKRVEIGEYEFMQVTY